MSATKADLDAAVQTLKDNYAADKAAVIKIITDGQAETNRLLALIAAGSPDLQATIDSIKAVSQGMVDDTAAIGSADAQINVEGV